MVAVAYDIELSHQARDHLRTFTARHRAIVLDEIEEQLTHQPTLTTRNRKPLQPNPIATWELRIGDFRVYYDVQDEPAAIVFIRAIGVKERNEVWIGGERSSF